MEDDSEMSWKLDTSPIVIYQAKTSFADFARHGKRSFAEFAEREQVQNRGISELPRPQALYSNSSLDSSSPPSPIWRQQHTQEQGEFAKAWPALAGLIGSFTGLVVSVATNPINRASWRTVSGALRWMASKNRRIDTTCTAIIQLADGAKRRYVDLTSHREEIVTEQDVVLQRHRNRVASQRRNESNFLRNQQDTRSRMQGPEVPHEGGYYMSGALMYTNFDGPSTPGNPQRMPGAWSDSPVNEAAHYYNNVTPITDFDTSISDPLIDTMDTGADSNEAIAANHAWPYYGNEFHQVELKPLGSDDGDSLMTPGNISDQDTSFDSLVLEESSSADSSSVSADHDMLDDEHVDIDSDTSEEYETYGVLDHQIQSTSPISRLDHLGSNYSSYNCHPDAVQRAAAEEFDEILKDETLLSDDAMDQDTPVRQSSVSTSNTPADIASPVSSAQLDLKADSEASPPNISLYSTEPTSFQELTPSHGVLSPEDSPAWAQGTPGQHARSPLQGSPIVRQMPPPAFPLARPLTIIKEESPQKRVAFYESPKTGKPVNRYKKFIPGESMDVSYLSASTEEDFSILSDVSASAQLHTSPTYQEHLEKQLAIDRMDQQFLQSVTPSIDVVLADAHPHIPVLPEPPPRVLTRISNPRIRRRRDSSRFTVTQNGSPMRLRSAGPATESLAVSSVDDTPSFVKYSFAGKENDSPSSQAASSPGISVIVPQSTIHTTSLTSNNVATQTRAKASLAHGKERFSKKKYFPSNQATPIAFDTTEAASEGALAHGKDSSSNEESSPSNQVDAPDAPTSPTPSSSNGKSMHAQDYSSRESSSSDRFSPRDSPSLPLESASPTASAEDASVEGTLENGTVDTPVKGTVSPSTQVDASTVADTPGMSLAEGTLVHGQNSPSTKDSSSPSNQVDASAASTSPAQVARQLENLNVSGRRTSFRQATKARKDNERRLAKEAKIAAEKARKEKEEAEAKARKAKELAEERKKRGLRRMPVEKIIKPLSEEWDAKVDAAMHEPMTKVISSSVSLTDITRRDLGKVLPQRGVPGEDPRGWLNDTIITAYLEAIVDHALKSSGHKRGDTPKMVALSTYFYPKLAQNGAASVDRWIKRSKIEGKKMKNVERIFIPVNQNGTHWTLLVVSPKFKTIEYFDSMHGGSSHILRNAKHWVKHNLADDFVEDEWTIVDGSGPTQHNGSDCGVFVSTTAKMISMGVDPLAYSDMDMPVQRRRIVAEIINRGFEGDLAMEVVFAED